MELQLSHPDAQLKEQFLTLEEPQDIAHLLEITYPLLEYWLFIAPPTDKYITFTLHKASGGFRIISAPTTTLKIIQQKLNQVLRAVYEVKKPVHGFVTGKSIVTNALVHTKQHYVFNVDLQDFFPSINFGRVRGLFMGKPYNLPANVATVLAQICCHENALPQGAPTSPIVANLICGQLDDQLLNLARKHGCRYTRYADDITFSSSRLIFPPTIAFSEYKVQGDIGKIYWQIGSDLESLIQNNGFKVNLDKVRMQTINQHQEVTGLTTNAFPNVNRQYIRQIRAMLHAWKKFGPRRAQQAYYNQHGQGQRGPYKDDPPFKQIVKGKIEFLGMVRGKDNPIYQRFQQQYKLLASHNNQRTPSRASSTSAENLQRFSFSQWIETLPFPLASILHVYDADDDEKGKYERLLQFFEALAAFWATILLSGFHQDEQIFTQERDKLSRTLREKYDLSLMTFGVWVRIVEVLTARLRKMKTQPTGLQTFSNLFKIEDNQIFDILSSKKVTETLSYANSLRNKKAHAGFLSLKEASQKHAELRKQLEIVIEVFGELWTRYRLITPIDNQFESNLFNYRIKYVTGSNSTYKKSRQVFIHPLETGHLFLAAPNNQQALRLWPLIRLGSSPETKQTACYFYNSRGKDGIKWIAYHLENERSDMVEPFQETITLLNLLSDS